MAHAVAVGDVTDDRDPVDDDRDAGSPVVVAGSPAGGGGVNLFAAAALVAGRAASADTRRQYTAIYRSFSDWLAAELGRAPQVSDLDADVIAAYGRHLETTGGRGGRPAALSTRRVYLAMLRSLARELGAVDAAAAVRVPRHRPIAPDTITRGEYQNLLRVPDRRTVIGKRDYALLRVLGDCGLRSAESRRLTAVDMRRPRSNGRHQRFHVHGKGDVEREAPIPEVTQKAIDAWIAVHPLARGRAGLRDDQHLFVRIGPYPGAEEPEPLSAQSIYKIVNRAGLEAGIPERHCHPHALRAYWATELLEDDVPVHRVQRRLGHADLRTTGHYAVEHADQIDDVADVIDRREQAQRRQGR